MINSINNRLKLPKVISIEVTTEGDKSYQVVTYDTEGPGKVAQQKFEVDKEFYQKQIDKLQEQIDVLTARKDACIS